MAEERSAEMLIESLRASKAGDRLEAANRLADVATSSPEIVLALEHVALLDSDNEVRIAALRALNAVAHRRVQWDRNNSELVTNLSPSALRGEIDQWRRDGLIGEQVASVLKQRYPIFKPPDAPPIQHPAPATTTETPAPERVAEAMPAAAQVTAPPALAPAEGATLSQVLLGDTAIRVALYLGAFFVVAAAFIIAALVEVARVPVLSVTTLALLGSAWILSRRLPTAGFVLLIAGGLVIPIDAGAVVDLFKMIAPGANVVWAGAFLVTGVVWAIGAGRFDSRVLSLLSFASIDLATFFALQGMQVTDVNLYVLALSGVALGTAAITLALKESDHSKLFYPLFIPAQLQGVTLAVTVLGLGLVNAINSAEEISATWWYASAAWLVLGIFYGVSDLQVKALDFKIGTQPSAFSLFRLAAVFCLWAVPVFGVQAIAPSAEVSGAVAWGWAVLMALASEALPLAPWERLRGTAAPLLMVAVPGMAFGAMLEPSAAVRSGFVAVSALILTGLSIRRPRWLVWSIALIAWTWAYFTLFALPEIEALEVFLGYVLVIPASIYLTLELLARKRAGMARGWTIPLLVIGLVLLALTGVATLFGFVSEPGSVAVTYLIVTVFLTVYTILDSRVIFWVAALAVSYLSFVAFIAAVKSWVGQLHGYMYLAPGLIYLALYFVTRRRLGLSSNWWGPAVGMAGVAFIMDVGLSLMAPGTTSGDRALIFLAWAASFGVLTLLESGAVVWWSGALIMVYASYSQAISTDFVRSLPVFGGVYHLVAALVFLTINLVARIRTNETRTWTLPPLAMAGVASLVMVASMPPDITDHPENGVLIYTIFAVYLAVYAVALSSRLSVFIAAVAGAIAFFYVLVPWQELSPNWAAPFTFLAVGYYVAGLGLAWQPATRLRLLGEPLQLSGLVLGAVASLAAFFLPGYEGVAGVALAATCVVVEAFRKRNVWLGYPANLMYLISYFIALRELNVTEPQFLAIGAALLGLVMHYLLLRSRSTGAAFATGLISQLLLQSTSYIQMLATQELQFFAALFFESLAILVYGLVIRSRSLLFIPILFLIVGTVTVAFSFLKGLSTAVIIGITGVVLLGLGILALLMRERLVRLVAILNTWEP